MVGYELKKVFFRTGNKLALLLLICVVGVTCFFATDVSYVNENGEKESGPAAVEKLKTAQKEWTGYLDEAKIRQAIAENKRIRETPEAMSKDYRENDIAYSWGQGIMEIRNLLNASYANGFREYDYYRADSLSEADAAGFYTNRTELLLAWLKTEAKDQFSEAEKEYLIRQYESIQTPWYYDYMKGWTQLFEFAPTVIMITMLILGYLVAGIFSNEFVWKADAVYFSSMYGRNKATAAKIKAGFCVVTIIYWAVIIAYTGIVLLYLGTDGLMCPIQADRSGWKSFYNISVGQKYLLIVLGGYIGCLFISFLCMLVSAKTKSAVVAAMIPVILIFVPSFLGNINSPVINKILGLLPDQLLQIGMAMNLFNLYTVGNRVFGSVPVLLVLYTVLTALLLPLMYREYCRKQIN